MVAMTFQPLSRKSRAVALPMPLLAPVMTMVVGKGWPFDVLVERRRAACWGPIGRAMINLAPKAEDD
jgi:hypothetical protein